MTLTAPTRDQTVGRSYRLAWREGPNGPRAQVRREGAVDALQVGVGRPASMASRLAGLLHPVCPRAHAAAALRAIEAAAGVRVSPAHAAARDAAVLGEAAAACVWRMALSWPKLLGDAPDAEPVRAARGAADGLLAAVFDGPWEQIGGAPARVDVAAARAHTATLAAAVTTAAHRAGDVRARADRVRVLSSLGAHPPLGGALCDPAATPDARACEETPRTLTNASPPRALGGWFAAQATHAATILDGLRAAVAAASGSAHDVEADGAAQVSSASGVGLGVAMTARGRLRHIVRLEDGLIAAWSAAAPTDWNFAGQGPAARVAAGADLGPDPHIGLELVAAAFDPCAPCAVSVETGEGGDA